MDDTVVNNRLDDAVKEATRLIEGGVINAGDLKEILNADGECSLVGIDKETWNKEFYDPHNMVYAWLFAKRRGLIKYVREDNEGNVVVRMTPTGFKFLNSIEG